VFQSRFRSNLVQKETRLPSAGKPRFPVKRAAAQKRRCNVVWS
jgi:hypothetical protein